MVVSWAYNAPTNTATGSGAGSTDFVNGLVAADAAGGWGKFTADATGTQIICNAFIVIGDGSTATVFSDSNGKQIMFLNGIRTAVGQNLILVKANSTFKIGIYLAGTRNGLYGCTIVDLESTYYGMIIQPNSDSASCNIELYGSTFVALNQDCRIQAIKCYDCTTISGASNGCHFIQSVYINTACDVNNLHSLGKAAIRMPRSASTYTNIFGIGIVYGVWFQNSGGVLKGLKLDQISGFYSIRTENIGASDCYLINADLPKWTIQWVTAGTTGKVFRQYEFDLTVTDASGTAIENATVLLEQADGTDVFSVSTDASGAIATQTVSRGYYAQATGDTLQDYGPFTLTVSKAGKLTYTHSGIVLDEKIDWRIALDSGSYGGTYIETERTVEKQVENPINEGLLLLSANLICQKRRLKNMLILEHAQKVLDLKKEKDRKKKETWQQ
jgi:hypothetical protein